MAVGFRRSISFQTEASSRRQQQQEQRQERARSSYRVRSASLPSRFHPLVCQLRDACRALRRWADGQPAAARAPSPARLAEGVALLALLLSALAQLLRHPVARDPLRRSPLLPPLLDSFLRLADAHALLRSSLLALPALLSRGRSALLRRDPARLSSALRSLRRSLPRPRPLPLPLPRSSSSSADDIASAVADAASAAAAASSALFSGLAALSASASASAAPAPASPWSSWVAAAAASCPIASPSPARASSSSSASAARVWWVVDLLRWRWRTRSNKKRDEEKEEEDKGEEEMPEEEKDRRGVLEKLEELEECVRNLEGGCENVYRALVNTRVALLNILTPTF